MNNVNIQKKPIKNTAKLATMCGRGKGKRTHPHSVSVRVGVGVGVVLCMEGNVAVGAIKNRGRILNS